jgi:hypothetical protein
MKMQQNGFLYDTAFRPLLSAQERADVPTLINLKTLRGGGGGGNPGILII